MSLVKISITGGVGAALGCALTGLTVFFLAGGLEGLATRQVCHNVADRGLEILRGLGE